MNIYQRIIYILKILLLFLFVLVKIGVIPGEMPFQIIVDTTFNITVGVYISYLAFPWGNQHNRIDREDLIILFIAGIISLFNIDYKEYLQAYDDFYNSARYIEEEYNEEYD